MSFKVLNSLILLGHSYSVIERYHDSQDDAKSTNGNSEPNSPTNQNHSVETQPVSAESVPEKTPFICHERRASDSKVSRNFSQIFAADSYSELTMVKDTQVIEQTEGFKMRGKCDSVASSASDLSKQEVDTVSCDHEPVSHGLINGSHDYKMADSSCEQGLKMTGSSDGEHNWKNTKYEDKLKPFEHKSLDVPVFQRGNKSVFMSFGLRKNKKFGSSASLPETVGIPECVENDDTNKVIDTSKSEKVE